MDSFILVIEPHDDLRELLATLLSRCGWSAVGVPHGPAAGMVMEKSRPRIILADYGAAALDPCRSLLRSPSAPPTLIMATRWLPSRALSTEFGNLAGCLLKPLRTAVLVAAIESVLVGDLDSLPRCSPVPEERGRKVSGTVRKVTAARGDDAGDGTGG